MSTIFDASGLRATGFEGGTAVARLRTRVSDIPVGPGVYVVLRTTATSPRFPLLSRGGWFKGKNPTVDTSVLRARWIATTPVLYIGKGDQLRRRVDQLLRYGAGEPVGHQGGRYLWQVEGCEAFIVFWRAETNARATESRLLGEFVAQYGSLPFANLIH